MNKPFEIFNIGTFLTIATVKTRTNTFNAFQRPFKWKKKCNKIMKRIFLYPNVPKK